MALDVATTVPDSSRLVIESGEQEGMIFPLRDSVVSIGRGPDNSIQVIDPRMSRNHTLIIRNGAQWLLRDLGSKNGTVINGALIQGDRPLSHGDRLQIGDTLLVFEYEPRADSGLEGSSGCRMLDDEGFVEATQVLSVADREVREDGAGPAYMPPYASSRHLSMLYEVADIISSILNLDELLEKVVDLVQHYLQPDRTAILLYDERYHVLLPRAVRRPADATDDIIISNSIIARTVNDQVALIVTDAPHDYRFRTSDSIVIQRIHTAICAPLIFNGKVLGVLYLDRRKPSGSYQDDDLRLMAGIAKQSATAISNSRMHHRLLEQHAQDRELQIARSIQEHLLPKEMPTPRNFEIAGMSQPARVVGGDYYDVIALPDGRLVLAIADVTGKGVPAAILLAALRTAVQIEVRELHRETLPMILTRLNQMVCRDTSSSMFATMVLGVLDPEAQTFTYCNAGHCHPMICLPGERIRSLETGGTLLGVMPGITYEEETVELAPGSVMLLYTDGVTDAMSTQGEMFGVQRLADLLSLHTNLTAEALRSKISEKVEIFAEGAEAFDDFTLLIVRSKVR